MPQSNQITAEELASCRRELERRWKSQIVDNKLLERAWQVVYDIATILYDEFGATQVTVFGSLTEPIVFTKSSDIDIAVCGLSDEVYTQANDKIMDIDFGFKIDLINFDTTKGVFRERLQQQAIPIKNEETPIVWKKQYHHLQHQVLPVVEEEIYEMNRNRLLQHIEDENKKIESTVDGIVIALRDIEIVDSSLKHYIEESITNKLADVYSGMERIFQRIAIEVDGILPRGSRWHKDLLQQMAIQRPERPPVISQETLTLLDALLEYRHKVNNIYADEIIYKNTEKHAKNINKLFQVFSNELNHFTDTLAQRVEDD